MNIVKVKIITESGCNPREGEYEMLLTQIIGGLDILTQTGGGDISLIRECVAEYVSENDMPADAIIGLVMKEKREREDVIVSRWYEVESATVINL